MTPFLRKLLGLNWLLLVNMLALAIFGVIAIYSATYMRDDSIAGEFWRKQANWVAVGFVAFMVTSLIDYRWIRWGALPMYLAGIGFLILTRFIGTKVYGSRSWLHLGPINFQPAQLAVIAGIMVLALFLSQFREMHPMLRLLLCGVIVGAPCLLILMQPDLGETIIWGPVLLALLFVGGIPLRYLICIVLIVATVLPLAANLGLKTISTGAASPRSLIPRSTSRGRAWAINQSLIAIGSGGWSGKGFKAPNTQIELGFLPATAVHNDYIFSAIGEQWGFVGGMFLIGAFALAALDVSLRGVFRRRSIWPAPRHWDYRAHFHPRFSERRDDHFDAAHHRCSVAPDQLQRFLRAHDHVRPRNREQRLGPSKGRGALSERRAGASQFTFAAPRP